MISSVHNGVNTASQLRWRCRRGMLELDLLLNNFVEMEYNNLTDVETVLFLALLDYQDQALLDLLLGKDVSTDVAITGLVDRIRSSCRTSHYIDMM